MSRTVDLEKKAEQEETLSKMKEGYELGFQDENVDYSLVLPKGLSEEVVRKISAFKEEPEWMLDIRLKALQHFQSRGLPNWGPFKEYMKDIDFDEITYFAATTKDEGAWDELPDKIKETFTKIGVPRGEQEALVAGSAAQYDSSVAYHAMQEELQKQGVIFLGMDEALKQHPDLVREYFGSVIPSNDNFAAALNTACWSGGSFIWVPPGVHVELPLSAYFRINSSQFFQGERTAIIAEEGSKVSYSEGCSAPSYKAKDSIHAAVVEIVAKPGAEVTYFTTQNWSTGIHGGGGVYNLVTKRAIAMEHATVKWIQAEVGSRLNGKYSSIYCLGEGARGEVHSMAFAGEGQNQDTGGKLILAAPNTSGVILSKSISKDGGIASYRGLVEVAKNAVGAKAKVVCDALILDEKSVSNTWPTMRIDNDDVEIEHEATVSKVGEEQIFYLESRGIPEEEAMKMIVNGFIEPVIGKLPMEYAVELVRLMEVQMEGSVG